VVSAAQISSDDILLLNDTRCFRDQVLQLFQSDRRTSLGAFQINSGSLQTLIEMIRTEKQYTLLPLLSLNLLSHSEQSKKYSKVFSSDTFT